MIGVSMAQVGIGTTTPSSKLEVVAAGTTSATTALKVGTSSGTILSVRNDGLVEVSTTTQGFLPPRLTAAQRDAIASPIAGLLIWCTNCGTSGELQVFNGTAWTNSAGGTAATAFICGTTSVTFTYRNRTGTGVESVTYGSVLNAATGKCWLDRNLGATQVATSSTDASSYGDLFQWGRGDDGHQLRASTTTSTLSTENSPGHGSFITTSGSPDDWRSPKNDNLWQGVGGINNPCPSGWRLPTLAEFTAESATWSALNDEGAFNSVLKLPKSGARGINGALVDVGSIGYIWTSTVNANRSKNVFFRSPPNTGSGAHGSADSDRSRASSVRCIKD
jgi:Fibrobacter succinogenes major domain (Fib_succ_major)